MLDRIIDTWSGWPVWAKWASGIAAVVVIQAAITASGERDFLAGFVQEFAAIVIHYGLVLGGFALAIWVGMLVAKRSSRTWLGWVVGSMIVIAVSLIQGTVVSSIPGIGWRVDAMGNCHTDWDGRSNPTVCD